MSEPHGVYEIEGKLHEIGSIEQTAAAAKGVERLLDDYAILRYRLENDEERNQLDDKVQQAMKALEEYDLKVGHMKAIKGMEAKIVSVVTALGETVRGLTWSAVYRKPYARVTWNAKLMDGFAASHPEILPFRKETTVAANVRLVITASLDETEEAHSGE